MAEQLKSVDVLINPAGIKVMGINSDGYLFHGVTTGEMTFCGRSCVSSMVVEGEVFCEYAVVPFTNKIVTRRLKYFDCVLFNEIQTLMLDFMTALKECEEKMEIAKSSFKEIGTLLE